MKCNRETKTENRCRLLLLARCMYAAETPKTVDMGSVKKVKGKENRGERKKATKGNE